MRIPKILLVLLFGLAYKTLASTNSVETIRKKLDNIICPTIHVEGVNIVEIIDFIKDTLNDYKARKYAFCGSHRQLTNQVIKIDSEVPSDRRMELLKDYPLVYMATNFISVKIILDTLKPYGVTYEITPDKILFCNRKGIIFDHFLLE